MACRIALRARRGWIAAVGLALACVAASPATASQKAQPVRTAAGGVNQASSGVNQAPARPLSNRAVLRWYRQRLPAQVIAARIRAAAQVRFDLSTAALQQMQRAGVPAAVLAAMIAAQARQALERERARRRRAAAARRQARRLRKQRARAAALRRAAAQTFWPRPRSRAFLAAMLPRLAWVAGYRAARRRGLAAYGFVLRTRGLVVAAWPRRRPPAAAQVRLGNGAIYDKPRLLDLDAGRGVLWLHLPARQLAALDARRVRHGELTAGTAAGRRKTAPGYDRSPRLSRAQRVYLLAYTAQPSANWRMLRRLDAPAAAPPGARLIAARLGRAAAARWGIGGRWLVSRAPATPGSPVFDRAGTWLGMALVPPGAGQPLLLPRGDLAGRSGRRGRRLLRAPGPAASRLSSSFYIEDRTGHDYAKRLAAELEKQSGLRRTRQRGPARWLLVLTLERARRRRWERLVVRDAATRARVWSGEEPIELFRRSAARRLADDWLRTAPGRKK